MTLDSKHINWSKLLTRMLLYFVVSFICIFILYPYFVMLCTAVVTGVITMLFLPRVALLGASGIVFAFILLSSITCAEERTIPLTFILVAVLYIGREIWTGLSSADNVSQLAHVAGGAVGSALGFLLNRFKMTRYHR